jgi:hypothetical protein
MHTSSYKQGCAVISALSYNVRFFLRISFKMHMAIIWLLVRSSTKCIG